jgi:hypothetical protein
MPYENQLRLINANKIRLQAHKFKYSQLAALLPRILNNLLLNT